MTWQIEMLKPTQSTGRSREQGIGSARFVMALAVIALHVVSMQTITRPVQASDIAYVIATIGRAAQ